MTTSDGTAPLAFATVADLDAWLTAHPVPHPGLWVKVAKKGSGIPSVSAADVNDVALCHGWITGQRKALDGSYYLQRITPRRPGSLWSMVNVRRVEGLTAAGRMRPGGRDEVASAQKDGRWDAAYASQQEAEVGGPGTQPTGRGGLRETRPDGPLPHHARRPPRPDTAEPGSTGGGGGRETGGRRAGPMSPTGGGPTGVAPSLGRGLGVGRAGYLTSRTGRLEGRSPHRTTTTTGPVPNRTGPVSCSVAEGRVRVWTPPRLWRRRTWRPPCRRRGPRAGHSPRPS
ncbi:hypothetical protein SPURM210S_01121 [Streptomyces purpurascens]|nr:hypothetical protein GCM10010303_67570 [Streptomyces purpurascens]